MEAAAYFIALAYILLFYSATKYLICGDDSNPNGTCNTYNREVSRQTIITGILINAIVFLVLLFGDFAPSETKYGIIAGSVLYFGYSTMSMVLFERSGFTNEERLSMSAVVFAVGAYLIHTKTKRAPRLGAPRA